MSEYFPKPTCFQANVKIQLELDATSVDTSEFSKN